jgi:hypothetical protein
MTCWRLHVNNSELIKFQEGPIIVILISRSFTSKVPPGSEKHLVMLLAWEGEK